MNEQKKTKKIKIRKSIALFVLGYIIMGMILVGGCVLIGLGYKHFEVYNSILQDHIKLGAFNEFQEYLNAYNQLAASNDKWVTANIDMFAPGVAMVVLSIILISIMLFFHFKKPKVKEEKVNSLV